MAKRTLRSDADRIRERVLIGLAAARTPGFNFAGHFLQIRWPRIGENTAVTAMTAGAHCRDASGEVNPAALGVLVDLGLSTAPRLRIEPGARQATIQLHLQFTGETCGNDLAMRARLEGFSTGAGVTQSITRGVLVSGGRTVCHASGTFVQLPAPEGVVLAPLPWQMPGWVRPEAADPEALSRHEHQVLEACDTAVVRADGKHAFIEHFWDVLPVASRDGARCEVSIAPQYANRVGHVQGGILLGLAMATAKKAAGARHPGLSTISAWFLSPGRGSGLRVRARAMQTGRRLVVIHTAITTREGQPVLEAISNHPVSARGTPEPSADAVPLR